MSDSKTKIVMLGTGTPRADEKRAQSCVAIIVNEQPYLIDFGAGVVQRTVQAHNMGITALHSRNLTRAFVTHMHADHTIGYGDLIFTPWMQGRTQPLEVYGPRGLNMMTDHINQAYAISTEEHIKSHPTDEDGYKVNAHEFESGEIYSDDNVRVEAFRVDHGYLNAFGFKFSTDQHSIVISGDTKPTDALIEMATGCDVLIHEVYSVKGFQSHTDKWQTYHSRVHTSSHELAEIANKARPKLLILYHQLMWTANEDELLTEIRERYDGVVESAQDLDVFEL